MATRPIEQGSGAAASNVVPLPTAAKRIVRQRYGRRNAFYEAKQACAQFPDRFIFPSVRAAMPEAELLVDVRRTPELMLAIAILEALPDDLQTAARERLKEKALEGSRGAASLRAGEASHLRRAERLGRRHAPHRGRGVVMANPYHPQPAGPGVDLEAALSVIPSLPRAVLERLVQRAIERLDDMDGDPDLECNGAEDEWMGKWWLRWRSSGPGCPISDPGGGNVTDERHDGDEGY
jgi:hypothetical protein